MAERIARAAERQERVLIATGHPSGIYAVHVAIANALRLAGVTLLTPAAGWSYHTKNGAYREIRWLAGVGVVSNRGDLNHTHSPKPMRAVLAALVEAGEALPDLVIADHGWAGAAAEAGVETVGFADSNDPALFVGEAEGKVSAVVPLDDNVFPHLYAPVAAHLVRGLK
jgi:hypothetical protein